MSARQELEALKDQYVKIGDRIKALEEKVKEEASPKLLHGVAVNIPRYSRIFQCGDGRIRTARETCNGTTPISVPVFKNQKDAEDFANAIEVMLQLRAQPGVITPDTGSNVGHSGHILAYRFGEEEVRGLLFQGIYHGFSPLFESSRALQSAIDTVGQERIKKALITLAKLK